MNIFRPRPPESALPDYHEQLRMTMPLPPEEIWAKKAPMRGDHIRVLRAGGLYTHHGIYVAKDEVIHFTGTEGDGVLASADNEVISTSLDEFLKGGDLEVKEYTDEEYPDLFPVEAIVSYARACIGDAGYSLIFNNCEHFANMCTLGRFRSPQVERVAAGMLPNEEDNMSFWGKVKDFFFGGGSGGSSKRKTTTTYEPDKVKIAEIEKETKLMLANKEQERIEVMKKAKLEILQYDTTCKVAIEEAKRRGFISVAQSIVAMQEKLNEIAEKRMCIIEEGSLPIVRGIEEFYGEVRQKIEDDNYTYSVEKLPRLLTLLEQYDEKSTAHILFSKRIEDDMEAQQKSYLMQLEAVVVRQNQVIEGFRESKNRIVEQTGELTAGLLQSMQARMQELGMASKDIPALSAHAEEAMQLPEPEAAELPALPETKDASGMKTLDVLPEGGKK